MGAFKNNNIKQKLHLAVHLIIQCMTNDEFTVK